MTPTERQFLIDLLARGAQMPSARELAQLMLDIDNRRRSEAEESRLRPPLVAGGQGREPEDVIGTAGILAALCITALVCSLGALAWRIFA